MNLQESIDWLAQVNSGYCYPKSYEDIDNTLPYFSVTKNYSGSYNINSFNYQTHDNAPRMPYVTQYLLDNIFPFVDGDLTGYYSIQLHDTYTYLEDDKIYDDVLTFGKRKVDKSPVVIPDCYFLGNWGGKYQNVVDKTPWVLKDDKAVFVGSTTGNRNPKLNQRIDMCLWARDKRQWCDFYITNIVQMKAQDVFRDVPEIQQVLRNPMTFEEQMKYKYMVLIDGNTNKWTVDTFFTKSLSLMMPSKDMLWYYPLLRDGTHYVAVDKDTLVKKVQYYNANPQEAQFLIQNGNKLANELFNQAACRRYLIKLFEGIAFNK